MKNLVIKTNTKREIVDITDKVQETLSSENSNICSVFVAHTTAAITTADLDPGTDKDMLDAFEKIIPQYGQIKYCHPHDPEHTPDHILSSLIGTSISVPIKNGKLVLGSWQRIVLIEFDGPRERDVYVNITSIFGG